MREDVDPPGDDEPDPVGDDDTVPEGGDESPPPAARPRPIMPQHVLHAIARIQRITISPEVFRAADQLRRLTATPQFVEQMRRLATSQQQFADAVAPIITDLNKHYLKSIAPSIDQFQRSLATIVMPSLESWQLQLPKFQPIVADLARFAQDISASWKRTMPPNWTDLEIDEVGRVVERIRTTGYCLVWVPRLEILRQVIDADAAETARVLTDRSEDVLDDCAANLQDVTAVELIGEVGAAGSAIRAYRDGHHGPAQAMAASVITSTLHVCFETRSLRQAQREMELGDPEDAVIAGFRLCTVFMAGNAALQEFDADAGGLVEFNRHNTAHRITPGQWTPGNGLAAIMLAVGLLRELDRLVATRREETSPSASATPPSA